MAGSTKHKGFKNLYGDTSNPTFGIAVGETSRALHIFTADDAATDWNVAADTHPSVYIHSATTPATDYIKIYHNATDAYVNAVGATTLYFQIAGTTEMELAAAALTLSTPLTVGVDDTGYDVTFFGATASSKMLWDESDDRLEFDGADINLQDSDILQFGDAQDVAITWDASNLTIIPATDNTGAVQIGNDGTKSMDLKLFGATASAYAEWDNSADRFNIVTVSGRAITGEEHAFDIVNGGTLSSGDSMVGCNVVTTASGTAGSWVSAGYFKTVQASKVVNGYLCGLEVELQSTAANASDNSVLVLNSTSNHSGSPPAATPYITLREYGTTYANVLFRVFGDTGQGTTGSVSTTAIISGTTGTFETNCDCTVRCMSGSTPIWLLGSTTQPS